MEIIKQRFPQDQPAMYRIQVDGKIDERLCEWFEDMTIANESGADGKPITILTGLVADQAALQGLLSRIYILGFLVISVTRVEENP